MDRETILKNADKIHTTELGRQRIKKNIGFEPDDIVAWCLDLINRDDCRVTRYGKNFYVHSGGYIITISVKSHTIITVHDQNQNAPVYGDEAFNMKRTAEVLFSESEAGAIKIARSHHPDKFGFEIICLGLLLDIGDIGQPAESEYRKNLISSLYYQEQFGKNPEAKENTHIASGVYAGELNKLRALLDDGVSLRIWYSGRPYSICGIYHLCSLLRDYNDNRIYTVRLPEHVADGNTVLSYVSWGEIEPETFTGFLGFQKRLSSAERNMFAMRWDALMMDNAPLRVIVNGTVIGVNEDFYDFLIWRYLTDIPVKEAFLIGKILGNYQLGIGDYWYASRIDYHIKSGKIKIVQNSESKYERMLCLA